MTVSQTQRNYSSSAAVCHCYLPAVEAVATAAEGTASTSTDCDRVHGQKVRIRTVLAPGRDTATTSRRGLLVVVAGGSVVVVVVDAELVCVELSLVGKSAGMRKGVVVELVAVQVVEDSATVDGTLAAAAVVVLVLLLRRRFSAVVWSPCPPLLASYGVLFPLMRNVSYGVGRVMAGQVPGLVLVLDRRWDVGRVLGACSADGMHLLRLKQRGFGYLKRTQGQV